MGRKAPPPKMRQERWFPALGYISCPRDSSIRDRKKLKSEGSDDLQKTKHIWAQWPQGPDTPLAWRWEHVQSVSTPCGHCALYGHHGKHNKSVVPCVSQVMTKIGVVLFLNYSLEVVNFLWPCLSLSTFFTCWHCLQIIALTIRSVTWKWLPIKICDWFLAAFTCWSEFISIQIFVRLNHRKNMKAEPSRLISRKPTENLELFLLL